MSNHRPIIGVSAPYTDATKDYRASFYYEDAIVAAGGIAVLVPSANNSACIEELLGTLDGILIPGGADVDPFFYGEEPVRGLGLIKASNDAYEINLIRTARAMHKPILSVCRGMQILNVAFGGTLYQDLPTQRPECLSHWQAPVDRTEVYHSVDIAEGSYLFEAYGEKTVRANSFHHQAVKDVAPGFTVSARARDGIIEAIEVKEERILGVQWHPEALHISHPEHLRYFKHFVEACKK